MSCLTLCASSIATTRPHCDLRCIKMERQMEKSTQASSELTNGSLRSTMVSEPGLKAHMSSSLAAGRVERVQVSDGSMKLSSNFRRILSGSSCPFTHFCLLSFFRKRV